MHYACVSHLWTKDIDLYSGPKVSWQFQFTHGNFKLFTAISIYFMAISIYSRQFHFTHSNFNLLTAIFRFAHHLSTTAADSDH